MTRFSTNDVSVLIPVYNAEHTIQRAVDSVLVDDNLPKEIIICDDASTDKTLAVIEELYGENERIKIISLECNLGAGVARRRLLEIASGNLIAFLDADDEWLKNKLLKQVDLMNNEQADLCICGYEIYDGSNKKIGARIPPRNISYFNMHFANWIPTSMVLFRANLKNSKQMSEMRHRQDYAFWLNLLRSNPKMKISRTPDFLGKYYRQHTSLSSSKLTNLKLNYAVFRTQVGYTIIMSLILVCLNAATRIMRA